MTDQSELVGWSTLVTTLLIGAGKLIAEIQRHGEQAVADGSGGIRERPGDERTELIRIINGKSQIITPIRRIGTAVEPALVGKGRALGSGRMNADKQADHGEEDYK